MLVKVVVSKEDADQGIPKSPLACAVSVALGKQFPGKVVISHTNEGDRPGRIGILHKLPSAFVGKIDPKTQTSIGKLSKEERKAGSAEMHECEYLISINLPKQVSDWMHKYDRGQLKSEDFPLTFELNFLTRAENRDRLLAKLDQEVKEGIVDRRLEKQIRSDLAIRFQGVDDNIRPTGVSVPSGTV